MGDLRRLHSMGQARLLCRLTEGYACIAHKCVGMLMVCFARSRWSLSEWAIILHPRRSNASSTVDGKRGYHDTGLPDQCRTNTIRRPSLMQRFSVFPPSSECCSCRLFHTSYFQLTGSKALPSATIRVSQVPYLAET